jgi:hypothetical protein
MDHLANTSEKRQVSYTDRIFAAAKQLPEAVIAKISGIKNLVQDQIFSLLRTGAEQS